METRSVATVFGGSGFIGRYLVKRLTTAGYVVRVAVRDPTAASFLRPLGRVGQVVPLFASLTEEGTVHRAVTGADLVVNLVGILAERRAGDFARIHAQGAGTVARLAAQEGVQRLVHVSAIGADPNSPSAYGRSKAAGETAVRQAIPGASILRPSIVFGPEDQFFNRFAALAAFSPVMPVIAGETKFQPVYVADVADAIMHVLTMETPAPLYELGGPRIWSFREIIAWILKETHRHRPMLNLSMRSARLLAVLGNHFPGLAPTRDQLAMLSRDNVVSGQHPGLHDLGIVPAPVELVVPSYLVRFRPGGGRRDVPPGFSPQRS